MPISYDTTQADAGPSPPASDRAAGPTLSDQPGFILLLLGALYFAQGLPLGLIFGAYPVLLRGAGAELSLLAWVPLLGLPWMLKVLWSPLVDNHWRPALGRRRSWLLSQQGLVILSVALLVGNASGGGAVLTFVLLGLASLFAATQDIATDGLAAERLKGRHLAHANAFSVGGMAAGTLVGGGGILMIVDALGLQATLLVLVALLCACAIPALLWREDEATEPVKRPRASLRAVVQRPYWRLLLAIATLYAASHSADGALLRLYLVDRGWSSAEIGLLDTVSMTAMIILGCGGAAWLVSRFGVWTCLCASLVLLLASSLAWLALTWTGVQPGIALAASIRLVGSAGMGLASVAVYTMLMLFARGGEQAGTDVTAFKSANVFGEIGSASLATALAAQLGYSGGFGFSIAATLVVLAITLLRPSSRALDLNPPNEAGRQHENS